MANSTPWLAMCWTPSPIDSWFLHESLKGYRVISDENDLISMSDCIHCFVASQVEDIRWASFVAIHIRHDTIRETTLKEIITRKSSQLLSSNGVEEWLLNEIRVPKKYLSEAKAIKSKSIFDHKSLALNLIVGSNFSSAKSSTSARIRGLGIKPRSCRGIRNPRQSILGRYKRHDRLHPIDHPPSVPVR